MCPIVHKCPYFLIPWCSNSSEEVHTSLPQTQPATHKHTKWSSKYRGIGLRHWVYFCRFLQISGFQAGIRVHWVLHLPGQRADLKMLSAHIYKHSHPCNYVSLITDKFSTTTLYLELQWYYKPMHHAHSNTHTHTIPHPTIQHTDTHNTHTHTTHIPTRGIFSRNGTQMLQMRRSTCTDIMCNTYTHHIHTPHTHKHTRTHKQTHTHPHTLWPPLPHTHPNTTNTYTYTNIK